MKFVWKHEDKPVSILTQHIVNDDVLDATLCEEYIDIDYDVDAHGNELWVWTEPNSPFTENCSLCIYIAAQRVMDRARNDVAQELGVDESEVF